MEDTLSELFTECWGRLFYGAIMADNAFHTGVVGSGLNNEINLRTVVLRAVEPDEKQVVFYTDSRSAKMDDLEKNSNVSWLFYDAAEKIQVRVSGVASNHQLNDVAANHWDKVHDGGKRAYLAIPGPSASVNEATDGLEYLKDDSDLNAGYQNFAAIVTQVNFIEWLSLKDSGHRRAQFKLVDNNWKGQWLIP